MAASQALLAGVEDDGFATLAQTRPVVLHVDDDMGSLVMAEGALEDAGYDVLHASDGLQAIAQFDEHAPDLIIMDAIMPNMDGFEAISRIRGMSDGQHVPILMTTGLEDLASITRAYDEGATDFLTKPLNFHILPHRVHYMLRAQRTADELRASQARLDNAQRIARLGHWELHAQSGRMAWSSEFARILDFGEIAGSGHWQQVLDCIDPESRGSVAQACKEAIAQCNGFGIEFHLPEVDESGRRTILLEAEVHADDEARCSALVGTLQDITERTNAQKQIHNLAYFDVVTGLPNRAHLLEQLNYALIRSRRYDTQFALLFLDLDHFKRVNDTLGHDAGDDLLQQVSARLRDVVRESDMIGRPMEEDEGETGLQHTVARLGGDEFVVLLDEISQPEDAARVARRIAESISEPYTITQSDVRVTTTVGISVFPADGGDTETLMKHADVAMYHAKEAGRNGYQFYSRGIHERALARFSLEKKLRTALEGDGLSLVYQPKIALATNEVVGVEALLRWEDPEAGQISPADFIPMAEESGLIVPLGRWVLKQACSQMQAWRRVGIELGMAVNCSPVQFVQGHMIDEVEHALKASGLPAGCLEIELTESLLLHNMDLGSQVLQRLRDMGVRSSIDDFGTGFSCLSFLKRLPVDRLKVDRSFVQGLANDPGDQAIFSAILTLSHSLGLSVVAEGVESDAQLQKLIEFGVDEAQGYLFTQPLNADGFEQWLQNRRAG